MSHTIGHARRGFTLIEIMIAILIVGLMAAIVGPAVFNYIKRASITRAKADLKTMKSAIEMYKISVGPYPSTLKDLIKKPADENIRARWEESGPFIETKEVPLDPWSNPYVYKLTPGAEHPYELYSHGPNGPGSTEGRINARNL